MTVTELSLDELYEKWPKLEREDVRSLLEWTKKEPHFPQVPGNYLS